MCTDILVVFEGGGESDQLQAEYVDSFFQLAGIGMQLDQQKTVIDRRGRRLCIVGNDGCIFKPSQEKMSGRFRTGGFGRQNNRGNVVPQGAGPVEGFQEHGSFFVGLQSEQVIDNCQPNARTETHEVVVVFGRCCKAIYLQDT